MDKTILMPWQRVHTQYGIFDILWVDLFDKDPQAAWAGHRNRMVGSAADFGVLMFFSSWLGAYVSIELLEDRPAQIPEEWEDVVEVSTTVPPGVEPFWMSFDDGGPLPIPPGTWRLRVSARGRDDMVLDPIDEDEEPSPADRYLIQLWPAPPAPEEILRQTSTHNPIA